MVKHRDKTKWRAIEVATFVLSLQIQKQEIKEGEASYKKVLPADANWFERYGNEMSLSKARSIYRQAADRFGYKDTKEIQRLLRLVEHEGWHREVMDEFNHDFAAEITTQDRRFEAPEGVKLMLGLLSQGA
jgi:hypothetical protein